MRLATRTLRGSACLLTDSSLCGRRAVSMAVPATRRRLTRSLRVRRAAIPAGLWRGILAHGEARAITGCCVRYDGRLYADLVLNVCTKRNSLCGRLLFL